MSDENISTENKGNRGRSVKKPKVEASKTLKIGKKTVNSKPLEDWLYQQNFSVNPTVHVNGPSTEAAILSVDFGAPIGGPIRLSNEQANELTARMKRLAGEFYVGEAQIRVSYDQTNGVYWASMG